MQSSSSTVAIKVPEDEVLVAFQGAFVYDCSEYRALIFIIIDKYMPCVYVLPVVQNPELVPVPVPGMQQAPLRTFRLQASYVYVSLPASCRLHYEHPLSFIRIYINIRIYLSSGIRAAINSSRASASPVSDTGVSPQVDGFELKGRQVNLSLAGPFQPRTNVVRTINPRKNKVATPLLCGTWYWSTVLELLNN